MTIISRKPEEIIPADPFPRIRQRQWLYSHYAAFPDYGQRYEFMNGVLRLAASASDPRQQKERIVARFCYHLMTHVEFTGIGQVFVASFEDEQHPAISMQPDVLILLNEHKNNFGPEYIIGVPDLVVQVPSLDDALYDQMERYRAYARASVKEHWIVDTTSCTIEVLSLEKGEYRSMGVFSGEQMLLSEVVPNFPVQVKLFFD